MIRGSLGSKFRLIPTVHPNSKPVTMALEPARIIKGRITDAGTGKPIPHAPVSDLVHQGERGHGSTNSKPTPRAASAPIPSQPTATMSRRRRPIGQPYLKLSKQFDWPKGAVEHSIDLALPRGVVIHGKVVEEGSGRPVAGARISFRTRRIRPSRAPGTVARRAMRTARFGSRHCLARAISLSWAPATIMCFERSIATGLPRGEPRWPPLLCPRLHRLRPEAEPTRAWKSTSHSAGA